MARSLKGAWYILLILSLSFSLTLEEAERKALESSSEIRIETFELSKKEEEAKERFGNLLPQLNLELSLNLSRRLSFILPSIPPLPPQEFTFQREVYPKATLIFSQSLIDLPSKKSYDLARILREVQRYRLAERRLEVLYRVREAYINTLKAKAVLTIYRHQLRRVESHLRDVEELYREGIVPFKDVLETKVRLHEVREKLVSAEADFRNSLSYLSYLTGEEVSDVEEVSLSSLEDLSLRPPEELKELALMSRPVIRLFRETVAARREGVALARSYFYPKLVLEGFLQYTEESDLFPRTRYALSLALRWNLFSGLRRLRSLKIAEITKMQEEERLRDLERQILLELEKVLRDIRSARERVELARVRLKEAREHMRVAVEKYRAGLGTNTEVLDAESYLTEAEQTLKINTYELILRIFKLYRVVGYEG